MSDLQGDVVSWSGTWNSFGAAKKSDTELKDLCQDLNEVQLQIFPSLTATVARDLCRSISGSLPLPNSMADISQIRREFGNLTRSFPSMCGVLWLDVTDEETEGKWTKFGDSKAVASLPWKTNYPDGDIIQNCAIVVVNDSTGIIDTKCNRLNCAMCKVTSPPVWIMRGACEITERNKYFVNIQPRPGEYVFQGYSDYRIEFKNGSWLWTARKTGKTVAEFKNETSVNRWPQGRRTWLLKETVCDQKAGELRTLLLTPCSSGKFTCDDASCIPLYQRCDLKPDCDDGSDEKDCLLVQFPVSYRKDIPPRAYSNLTKTLPIKIYLIIESINVDTANMVMHTNLNLSMTWIDKRIDLLNLNTDKALNR